MFTVQSSMYSTTSTNMQSLVFRNCDNVRRVYTASCKINSTSSSCFISEFLLSVKIVFADFIYDTHTNRIGFYERAQLFEFRHVAEYTIFGQSLRKLLMYVCLRVSERAAEIHSLKYTYVAPVVRKITRTNVPLAT